ncbi:MAG: OsmC family protein [Gemmatimonadales bacterium]|jgi:putative redox protein
MGHADAVRAVRLEWSGRGLRFEGRGTDPATPAVTIDGDGEAGPSPMLALLLSAASCSGADVVVMLEKMRAGLERLSVEVRGVRRAEHPRRYVQVQFRFLMAGSGLDRAKAERAVSLSLNKYCSVVHSLAPDVEVQYELDFA